MAASALSGLTAQTYPIGFGGAQGADGNPVYRTGATGGKGGAVSPAPAASSYQQAPQQTYSVPNSNVYQQASQGLTAAMQGTAAGMSYVPMGVQAGQIANTNLGAYMNPYRQNVVEGLGNQAFSNYNQMANQLGTEATRAGAFGGSRHGVAQGAMGAQVQKDLNQQIGNLMYQGYGNAQQMAQQDIANRMQAQLANQQAGLAGAQTRLGAAQQMGGLAQTGFGMGQDLSQQMLLQGAMQQQLQQDAMDRAVQQYQGYQQAPYTSLAAMTQAVGGTPYPQSSTTTSSGNQKRGLFDYLMLGAMLK